MSLLVLFFVIPFLVIFFLFMTIEILLLPVIFLLASLFSLMLFSGVFFWLFLALSMAAVIYLALHLSNLVFKKLENKKVFKFIIIFIIVIAVLGLIQKRVVHTEIQIIDSDTGEMQTILENFIN